MLKVLATIRFCPEKLFYELNDVDASYMVVIR